MWLFSDQGIIHANRVLRVLPPEFKESKTIRVEVEGEQFQEARVSREDAVRLVGFSNETAKESANVLSAAIEADAPYLKKLAEEDAKKKAEAEALSKRYTTLDQLEAAVKAFREAEAREGVKIEYISILPLRHRSKVGILGPTAEFVDGSTAREPFIDNGEDCEQTLISRVEKDGKMKMIATSWHPKKLAGIFWATDPDLFYGRK